MYFYSVHLKKILDKHEVKNTFEYTFMMERQLVYLSLQRSGTIIDSAEQYIPCAKLGLFQQKKK